MWEWQNEMVQVACATSVFLFHEYAFIFFNSLITSYGVFPSRGPLLLSVPRKDRFRAQSKPLWTRLLQNPILFVGVTGWHAMNETRMKFYYKAVKCCQGKLASGSVSTTSFYVDASKLRGGHWVYMFFLIPARSLGNLGQNTEQLVTAVCTVF